MFHRVFVSVSVLSCFTIVFAGMATSQSFDPTLTDPDAIAAECGGTAAAGMAVFEGCATCHALTEDGPERPGPHLQSLFGRRVASVDGYDYGGGLRLMGAAQTIWERETLHAFLSDPQASPGHPVVPVEQDRRDLLTHLRTASLPTPPAPGELVVPDDVLAIEGDPAYGEYLASECAGCHQDGSGGIPSIKGMDHVYFVTAMHEYRARSRENETMRLIAARLTDEEIAALSAYLQNAE